MPTDTAGAAKKPEEQKPVTWTIFKIAAKQTWVGTVEAADADEAIEKGAEQFNQPATKLIAARYR